MSELCDLFEAEELSDYTCLKTRSGYATELKIVKTYFVEIAGDPKVRAVKRRLVKKFRQWRTTYLLPGHSHKKARMKASDSTIRKSMSFLSVLLDVAIDEEIVEFNPARKARRRSTRGRVGTFDSRRRPEFLTEQQYRDLLIECLRSSENPEGGAACREPAELAFAYALIVGEAGLRNESEALWLKYVDIDFEQGMIFVADEPGAHRTKNRQGRFVPMTKALRDGLRPIVDRYHGTGSPWLFHYTSSGRAIKPGDRIKSMNKRIMDAASRAAIPERWQMYDLRHRRITLWLKDGMPLLKVMEVAGHSQPQTTRWYTHFLNEHLVGLGASSTLPPEAASQLADLVQDC